MKVHVCTRFDWNGGIEYDEWYLYFGDIAQCGGKSPKEPESSRVLAELGKRVFEETDPLRQTVLAQGQEALTAPFRPVQPSGPEVDALKSIVERQFQNARENVIASAPRGGALTGALGDLEGQRAFALSQGLGGLLGEQRELARQERRIAQNLAIGAPTQATQSLGTAGNIQGQIAAAQATRSAGKSQALGTGLGAAAGFFLGGPAGAAAGGAAGGAAGSK